MLATALSLDGPAAFRYPRGPGLGVELALPEILPVGKGRVMLAGGPRPDALVVAYGAVVPAAVAAGRELALSGIKVTVVDARFARPLDEALILDLASAAGKVLTVEEGVTHGGFGSKVLEALSDHGLHVPVRRLGLPDRFVEHGNADRQKAAFGLDAAGIAAAVRELVGARAAAVKAG